MTRLSKTWLSAIAAVLTLVATPAAFAQGVTTGALAGVVADQSGGVLPGATVEAVHEPTGTRYSTVTRTRRHLLAPERAGGRSLLGDRVPLGLQDREADPESAVALGEQRALSFKLERRGASRETIEVVSSGGDRSSALRRPAPPRTWPRRRSRALPTVGPGPRGLRAPLSPLQLAGLRRRQRCERPLGGRPQQPLQQRPDRRRREQRPVRPRRLAARPAARPRRQPISLDAIQELQLVVSPYDVRQGGFSGGGINAITKSGTNEFHGTAYFFRRNEDLVGRRSRTTGRSRPFSDKQFGGSLGGPIVKNKAFFFVNVDYRPQGARPSGFSVDGQLRPGLRHGRPTIQRASRASCSSQVRLRPGRHSASSSATPTTTRSSASSTSTSNDQHRLTLRHNYVKAHNDIGCSRPARSTSFPDAFYQFREQDQLHGRPAQHARSAPRSTSSA